MTARLLPLSIFLAAAIAIVGCSRSVEPPPPDDTSDDVPPINVPPEDLKALVDGNNQFAIDLYKKLAETEKGNIVFSPYSISSALAMTYAGARGKTAEEMAKVLHFELDNDRLHPAFRGTTDSLKVVFPKKSGHGVKGVLGCTSARSPREINTPRRNEGGRGCRRPRCTRTGSPSPRRAWCTSRDATTRV